ncbi:hypothetical protein A1O7_06216 [Cladophialophora yegresii CBS 114405]|uniref:Cell wall mannoprotein n=1 Tax=Cladophialophora yegresii CBS 114405 TaxID=1182544 RepID=W9W2N5_9EURO|nr:uncharacterized protein A1O7_06216 [Cladophialophora yegresii CBS 114405]EXJ58786.1 hypothetical protein A1O7_06216 [Cladophialophora yegresii CBS 114405]
MKPVICISLLLAAGVDLAAARPANLHMRRVGGHIHRRSSVWNTKLGRREVPQEHSHEKFLTTVNTNLKLDNPDNIVDAVFGLLGNAAASAGQGDITDTDCLQQATADQAFTNAKANGDVDGMTAALIYRALERNTGAVGQASVACTSITPVNPEIAAISQHQDPASDNATSINKDIALALAVQIANIGGNPLDALQSGTFAPGEIGDPTGAGNTCDVVDEPVGCIFTQNLLVEDASEDEVNAAVAASATANAGAADATALAECTAAPDDSTAVAGTTTAVEAASTTVTEAATQTAEAVASSTAAATGAAAAESGAATSVGSSNLDLGSCDNPTIIFADNLDGRKEASFAPADETTFTHGSALNIKVISDFVCQQLETKCQASQEAIDACNQGATAAQGETGQAAADAFNQALGF